MFPFYLLFSLFSVSSQDKFQGGGDRLPPNLFCHDLVNKNEDSAWKELYSKCLNDYGNSRVFGGLESNEQKWAFIVKLKAYKSEYNLQKGSYMLCSGTIIAENWIITAAHCFDYGASYHVEILAAEISYTALKVIIHPDYVEKATKLQNDFALIYAPSLSSNSNCKRPACLSTRPPPAGAWCHIAGWGKINGFQMASELQETSVNILSDDYCVNNSMFKLNELNFDVEFCAGMPDSNGNGLTDAGKDACQGDSGGPLVCISDKQPFLHGIISWGKGCAREGLPGIYSKIHSASKWIQKTMNSEIKSTLPPIVTHQLSRQKTTTPKTKRIKTTKQPQYEEDDEPRWSKWSKWSKCKKDCTQERRRDCEEPRNRNNKMAKIGNSKCIQKRALSDRMQKQGCWVGQCKKKTTTPKYQISYTKPTLSTSDRFQLPTAFNLFYYSPKSTISSSFYYSLNPTLSPTYITQPSYPNNGINNNNVYQKLPYNNAYQLKTGYAFQETASWGNWASWSSCYQCQRTRSRSCISSITKQEKPNDSCQRLWMIGAIDQVKCLTAECVWLTQYFQKK